MVRNKKIRPNKVAERANYLLQASSLSLTNLEDLNLSISLTKSAMKLIEASPIRIHPESKRSVCKHCKAMMVPEITCNLVSQPNDKLQIVCNLCGVICSEITLKKEVWNYHGFVTDDWKLK